MANIAWCVYCRKDIPIDATKCPFCNKALSDNAKVVKCPSCGKFIIKSATKCQHCGAPILDDDWDEDDDDEETGKKKFKWWLIPIAIVLLIILLPSGKSNDKSSDTVSTRTADAESSTLKSENLASQVSVVEYTMENSLHDTYYVMVFTNNSKETIKINANVVAKDSTGAAVGAHNLSENDIASGESVCLMAYFDDRGDDWNFEYTMDVQKETFYSPVYEDINITKSILDDKIILTVTNTGEKAAEFVEATALFFSDGNLVNYGSTYINDSDYELKPGATLSGEIDSYYQFDDVQVFVHGRR